MTTVDAAAEAQAREKFALPACLHIPIAAREEADIRKHVGNITQAIMDGSPPRALLVEVPGPRDYDATFPIWQVPESEVLFRSPQLWVHVDLLAYRRAYVEAFPHEDLKGLVLDHVLNRRVARLKGFAYLRLVPITRGANSSSGGLSEKWAVEYHSSEVMQAKHRANPARTQNADLADIVKMLNRKSGGSHQDPVNEAQALVKRC
jgi:hypothetical protein